MLTQPLLLNRQYDQSAREERLMSVTRFLCSFRLHHVREDWMLDMWLAALDRLLKSSQHEDDTTLSQLVDAYLTNICRSKDSLSYLKEQSNKHAIVNGHIVSDWQLRATQLRGWPVNKDEPEDEYMTWSKVLHALSQVKIVDRNQSQSVADVIALSSGDVGTLELVIKSFPLAPGSRSPGGKGEHVNPF